MIRFVNNMYFRCTFNVNSTLLLLATIDEDENGDEKPASLQGSVSEKSNLLEDWLNVLILILLYTMQGLMYGFTAALPVILQSKKVVTYSDQALFSVVQWPYSLKLLCAPMMDTLYLRCIGRRKSWLLPIQYFMSILLFYFAYNIDDWMPESGKPKLQIIICVLFAINVLSASQDIVVDGWALTMLKKNNVGYASSCNGTGFHTGLFIGNVCLILLSSEEFCNKYLRTTATTEGVVTIKSFLYFWGIVCSLITTLVGIFKSENDARPEDDYTNINIFKSYKLLLNILKIEEIKIFLVAIFTSRIWIVLTESLAIFKLIDAGVLKEDLAVINTSTFVLKIFLPIAASKYAVNLKPMSFYLKFVPARILWGFTAYPILIYFTPYMLNINGVYNVPTYYYFAAGFIFAVQEILITLSTTSLIAFFAQISDPRIGSTYMTLFGTVRSIGFSMSNMLVLKMVDVLTFHKCSNGIKNDCPASDLKNMCHENVQNCEIIVDGYYLETALCLIIGFVWLSVFKSHLKNLESKDRSYCFVISNQCKK